MNYDDIQLRLAADDNTSESIARLIVLGIVVLGGLLSRLFRKKSDTPGPRPTPRSPPSRPPPDEADEADEVILLPPLPPEARPARTPPAPPPPGRVLDRPPTRVRVSAGPPAEVKSRIRTDRIQTRVATAVESEVGPVERRSRGPAPSLPGRTPEAPPRRAFGTARIRSALTGRDALRTAVVTAELLRPPLALRDPAEAPL